MSDKEIYGIFYVIGSCSWLSARSSQILSVRLMNATDIAAVSEIAVPDTYIGRSLSIASRNAHDQIAMFCAVTSGSTALSCGASCGTLTCCCSVQIPIKEPGYRCDGVIFSSEGLRHE